MDTLYSMRVFKQVIDMNSFVGASEKLDISTSVTSKHIKYLEEYLDVRLINRTSRRLSLTPEGKIFYDSCVEILNGFDETEASLKSKKVIPKGLLKVATPVWFINSNFTDAIASYLKKYPEVIVEVSLNDRIVDLVEDGIDVALRITNEPHSTLIARRICEIKFALVGSKEYLKTNGIPKHPSDLGKHKFIVINNTGLKTNFVFKINDKVEQVEVIPTLTCNNTSFAAQASASGIGLALLPELLIRESSTKSELKILLSDYAVPNLYFLYAVYSTKRFLSPKVRTFIDFMVEWYKKLP